MNYGMAVLTALFTFISPCVLPLLPVYVSYFAGEESNRWKTFFNALAFCVGISLFFVVLFATAITIGYAVPTFISKYQDKIYVVCGMILILFGLKFMGYLNLPFLNKTISFKTKTDNINVINAFVLGLVFSLSMGMCAIGFMSFDLMIALTSSSTMEAILIGVLFTLTLDVLFLVCAMLIDQLKGVFSFIKRHYKVINMISGGLLVVLGIIMALGFMRDITAWIAAIGN